MNCLVYNCKEVRGNDMDFVVKEGKVINKGPFNRLNIRFKSIGSDPNTKQF